MQQELPGLTGFSETGIKDMRIFYEAWAPYIDRQLPVAELDQILPIADFENRQPSVADLTEADIVALPVEGKKALVAEVKRKKEEYKHELFMLKVDYLKQSDLRHYSVETRLLTLQEM